MTNVNVHGVTKIEIKKDYIDNLEGTEPCNVITLHTEGVTGENIINIFSAPGSNIEILSKRESK